MISAYHFVGDRLRNGDPVPLDGDWLEYLGPLPLILCERGLHGSEHPLDALYYAPGSTLCRVDLDGEIVRGKNKCVATRRRIVCRADATAMLRAFARWCALQVIHRWDAPPVVRQYLKTGDGTLRAAAEALAWDAAEINAEVASRAAAWAAAWAAAEALAWDAAKINAWDAAKAAAWAAYQDTSRAAAGAAARAAQQERFAAMTDALLASGRRP